MKKDNNKNDVTGCRLRVLGVDPGTATVGWAVLDETRGEVKAVAYGHISTSPKNTTAERLFEVADNLEQITKKYRPNESAVEDLFFFKNMKTVMKVSQARGAILLTLEKNCVSVFEYTPLQVKQALTGYGRAEKKQVQIMVQKILKLKNIPKPDDTADAIAIALCHINSRKMNNLKK
jgi:crossover junction endodeoxyribonuclease RuvC